MTRDEFEAGLDRYGGDLTRWPPTLRREAEALTDRQAAAALDAARRLDTLVAEVAAPATADAALIGRIVSRGRQPHHETVLRPTRRLAVWASAAVALTLMTGFAAGAILPSDASSEAIAGLMFSGDTADDIAGDLL